MGKILDLSERLRGQLPAEPRLTLRERLDKAKKTRTQVIEMLEAAYSKYLELGENYKTLAAAYQNSQRLATLLTLHGAGTQMLDGEGRIARDEITLVVDQSIGDGLAGDKWDLTGDPLPTGQMLLRLRRRVEDRPQVPETKTAGSEG